MAQGPARTFSFFLELLRLEFRMQAVHRKNEVASHAHGRIGSHHVIGLMKRTQLALSDPAEWLGDWHPLAEQLGSADGLVTLGSVSSLLQLQPVRNVSSLRNFLRQYQRQI